MLRRLFTLRHKVVGHVAWTDYGPEWVAYCDRCGAAYLNEREFPGKMGDCATVADVVIGWFHDLAWKLTH